MDLLKKKKGVSVNEKPGAKQEGEKMSMSYTDFFNNRLQIPVDVADEAAAKNLVLRWINAKEFRNNQGMHKSYWQIFKADCLKSSKDSIYGADPEGILRRGDLILGCRSRELHEAHQGALEDRNRAYKQHNKKAAQKMRQDAARAGVDIKIHEGYYENE